MMKTASARMVYFSPTQTTKRILEAIAQGVEADGIEHLDLTPPEAGSQGIVETDNQLTIIGVPVYGGRVPQEAIRRLQRLKARKSPAVVVVLYGNRAYEDALLELRDLAVGLGFTPVGAGAFIGEHSYDSEVTPIATGRPDQDDLRKAREFGRKIQKKLDMLSGLHEVPPLPVPGKLPHRERGTTTKLPPESLQSLCTRCGKCATVCPTAAVTVGETVVTVATSCISCCACVKNCPTKARVIVDPGIRDRAEKLSKTCGDRKEPEIYL
jgi:ferredoxin